jgi:hypothetical protein
VAVDAQSELNIIFGQWRCLVGILIKAKGMVDVEQLTIRPNVFVLIEDDKIVTVDSLSELEGSAPAEDVIDLSDKYILPGLINSHLHLSMPGDGSDSREHRQASDSFWLICAIKNARTVLKSGVTTVRDCGDRNGVVQELRTAIENGILDGPGIVQSGDLLTITGGHAWDFGIECDGVDSVMARGAPLYQAKIRFYQNNADRRRDAGNLSRIRFFYSARIVSRGGSGS